MSLSLLKNKCIMISLLCYFLLFPNGNTAFRYAQIQQVDTGLTIRYNRSLKVIDEVLKNNSAFKRCVVEVEKAYKSDIFDTADFNYSVNTLVNYIKTLQGNINNYSYSSPDSVSYFINMAMYHILCRPVDVRTSAKSIYHHRPFVYNFQDPFGKQDWSSNFVSSLLISKKGNCRSLTYLYKILADEVGVKCWLALAPNHIYIRNHSQKIGWYNTELTSGTFPTDAWIAASGYVSTDAIRSGIYMDTLSNQQSIALCILDLAKGYEIQTQNYYDGFILKCCELVLQYHPVNPMALLLKAETLKKVYFKQAEEKSEDAASTYAAMEAAYLTLAKLHYREMPEKMYREWLLSISKLKNKYANKKLTGSIIQKKGS